jgi:hypothetical protein
VNWKRCKYDMIAKKDKAVGLLYFHSIPDGWKVQIRFEDRPPRIVLDCRLVSGDARRTEAFPAYGSPCVANPSDEEMAQIAALVAKVADGVGLRASRTFLSEHVYATGLRRYELSPDYGRYDDAQAGR